MQHHAYLYEGPVSLMPALAAEACERFSFERHPSTALGASNPDVVVQQWEKFGIEEARELSQTASLKSTSGRSLFVLGISSITSEAQQALLKLFEEPRPGALFVVLMPHGTMLPTLRSRFLDYPSKSFAEKKFPSAAGQQGDASGNLFSASEFLSSAYAKRSAWITVFLKNDDEDMREQVRTFVNGLEIVLYAELQKTSMEKFEALGELRSGLADIAHFRQYLADRAPSLKMILEHFAATLPKI